MNKIKKIVQLLKNGIELPEKQTNGSVILTGRFVTQSVEPKHAGAMAFCVVGDLEDRYVYAVEITAIENIK